MKKRVRFYDVDDLVKDVLQASLAEMRDNNRRLTEFYVADKFELERLRTGMRLKPMEFVWRVSDPTQYPERFTIFGVTIKPRELIRRKQ